MTDKASKATSPIIETLQDPGFVIGAILALYGEQEPEEKAVKSTAFNNGAGFNSVDAPILSSFASFYMDKGYLSPKQIEYARPKLYKYAKQLSRLVLKQMPIAEPTEVRERQQTVQNRGRYASLESNSIVITFPYNPETVAVVKGITGRKWNADKKYWTAPLTVQATTILEEEAFTFSPELAKWVNAQKGQEIDVAAEIKLLGGTLRPFQGQGVNQIEMWKGRAVLADEMGLGKTPQALAFRQLHPEINVAIFIVPQSVKMNWVKEATKWLHDPEIFVLNGRPKGAGVLHNDNRVRRSKSKQNPIIILNYDIAANWKDELMALEAEFVVLDECQYIKNTKAARTKAICGFQEKEVDPKTRQEKVINHPGIATAAKYVLPTSGTPLTNRPLEYWPALHLCRPDLFPSFWKYAQTYCGAQQTRFGWDFTGATNTMELHKILSRFVMIRRLKADVLKELPAKERIVVPMELTPAQKNKYNALVRKLETARNEPGAVLTAIETLKQTTAKMKMDGVKEWIRDYLDSGKKLVVFATHHLVIDEIMEAFHEFSPVKIDGRDSNPQVRQDRADAFQNDPKVRLFVGNIKAAGVGITLTAADSTCTIELGWTPGEHDQAEDRVHRIGQESDSVSAYYLVADGTLEVDICDLLDEKRNILAQVLEGREARDIDMLSELLRRMRAKNEEGV